jgi:acyl-CoA synthetase (AMP-forming)/AMP-acid ligase II
MYTSGTTGRPKGAQLTNANLLTMLSLVGTMGDWAQWQNSDVSLVVMPLFHLAGAGYAMVGFFSGAKNVLLREVVPEQILDAIGRYRVTRACFVPAVIQFLMQCPALRDADLSPLQLIIYGASPIPTALLRSGLEVFRCQFAQVYGLTETTGAITCLSPEEHADLGSERLLSCGQALDGAEIRVVGPTGESLPPRQVGEIVCRSALVMKGYWNLPDETAKAFDGDWFRTGDAGYLDEAGNLYIYDRIKDMIISGGENYSLVNAASPNGWVKRRVTGICECSATPQRVEAALFERYRKLRRGHRIIGEENRSADFHVPSFRNVACYLTRPRGGRIGRAPVRPGA